VFWIQTHVWRKRSEDVPYLEKKREKKNTSNFEMQILRNFITKDNGNACVVFFITFSVLMPMLCSEHTLQEYKNNVIVLLLELQKIPR